MGIRSLTKKDIRQQAIIHSSAFRKAYKGIIPDSFLDNFTVEKREDFFRKEFENFKDTFIIEDNNRVIGFATIGKCRDSDIQLNAGEIWGIYIHPDFWNKSYGTKLLQYTIEILKKRNYKLITLWVLEENYPGREFYEKNGFVHDGTRKQLKLGKDMVEFRYTFLLEQ